MHFKKCVIKDTGFVHRSKQTSLALPTKVLSNFGLLILNQNFAILVHIWVLRGTLPNSAYTAKLVDFK